MIFHKLWCVYVGFLSFLLKPEEAERFWFAFVLYSVRRLGETSIDNEQKVSGDKGFTLCQILKAAKLKYALTALSYISIMHFLLALFTNSCSVL